MSPRIAVLLSTYNGEAFLEAQLDSLLAQTEVELEVFARDDGSSDQTLAVLARYAGHWPQLAAPMAGPNLGPAASFMELLSGCNLAAFDYVAFCDQDDVWLPDKLSRAVSRLQAGCDDSPGLYCSGVTCVDRDLRPLGPAPVKDDTRFEHLLFENIAFGVTVVMNARAAALVRSRPPATGMIMHDWWCALVISAFGAVIYDERPGVLYRQHGENQIGQATSRLGEIARLARMFARAPGRFWPIHAQAAEFMRLFSDELKPRDRELVEALVSSKRSTGTRVAYVLTGRIGRSDLMGALAARGLILVGLY
ncbi:MAG TPA: glycosyltransferase family 2 protein [Caulobacteraceae bacterium]